MVDTNWSQLADMGKQQAQVAHRLARTQYVISYQLGHVIAFNDDYVHRRVWKAAQSGDIAEIRVRCLRCFAVASLWDWVRAARLAEKDRQGEALLIAVRGKAREGWFLLSCKGDREALTILDVVEFSQRGSF